MEQQDVTVVDSPDLRMSGRSLGQAHRPWGVGGLTAAAAIVAGLVALVLSLISPSRSFIADISDTDLLTEMALPVTKGLFNLVGAVTIGWLMAAAVYAAPRKGGIVDVGGYRALRAASTAAWVWAVTALLLIPIGTADALGRTIGDSMDPQALTTALSVLVNVRGYVIVAIAAVIIALASRMVLRITWAFVLLALSIVALYPMALAGHASQPDNHDFAVDSMIYHLVGAALWVGGLVALVGLARQGVRHMDVIARRYSTTALIAFVLVGVSGIINALLRFPYLGDLWRTDYGRMVLAKTALMVVLGVFGYVHRRRTIPQITANGHSGPLIRLAAVEIIVMAMVLGVAAALGRTEPPRPAGVALSDQQIVLGFDLPGPPSWSNMLLYWRLDLLAGVAAILAAGFYLAGVIRLRRRGDRWPRGRTISWLLGCLIVLISTSSGLGVYALAQFDLHMIMHMTLAMLAPIMLALGGPVTLLLRAIRPAGRGQPPGIREAVIGFVHSPFSRFLTHPLVVLPLFVASFYALYLTNLFDLMISTHTGHLFMTIHFVLTGYLYYWVIIGVDPGPRQLTFPVKVLLLFAAMPFHAFFGLAVMSSHQLLGADHFTRLALPWVDDLLKNQQFGGGIAWGFTEVPLVIVVLALMAQWARSDDRLSRRMDRRAEADHDADLEAYNRMLQVMHERARTHQP